MPVLEFLQRLNQLVLLLVAFFGRDNSQMVALVADPQTDTNNDSSLPLILGTSHQFEETCTKQRENGEFFQFAPTLFILRGQLTFLVLSLVESEVDIIKSPSQSKQAGSFPFAQRLKSGELGGANKKRDQPAHP